MTIMAIYSMVLERSGAISIVLSQLALYIAHVQKTATIKMYVTWPYVLDNWTSISAIDSCMNRVARRT
jgi:hypothetical protein